MGASSVSVLKGGEWMMVSVLEELKANERETLNVIQYVVRTWAKCVPRA